MVEASAAGVVVLSIDEEDDDNEDVNGEVVDVDPAFDAAIRVTGECVDTVDGGSYCITRTDGNSRR